MFEYKQYLKSILKKGVECGQARENMPSTKVLPTHQMTFAFEDGFPILTAKKMPFYSILAELICFMQGKTDVRDYAKMGCNVWWENAYKWNTTEDARKTFSIESYKKQDEWLPDSAYDLGRIYAAQWRSWDRNNVEVDQLKNLINNVISKPTSRYHVMTAWNPAELRDTCQPNCHVYFQATAIPFNKSAFDNYPYYKKFLDDDTALEICDKSDKMLFAHLTQRSCDAFLGVPYNITSYALFTIILGILTNSEPIQFDWVGVNNHIYSNHQDQVDQYIKSETFDRPKLHIEVDRIDTLDKIMQIKTLADLKEIFWLVDYKSGEKIEAPLSVGL